MFTKWYEKNGKDGEVVISTRIRFARNLEDYPFPIRASANVKKEIAEKVKDAVLNNNSVIATRFSCINMDNIDTGKKVSLVERHLVSPEFISGNEERTLLLLDDLDLRARLDLADHRRACLGLQAHAHVVLGGGILGLGQLGHGGEAAAVHIARAAPEGDLPPAVLGGLVHHHGAPLQVALHGAAGRRVHAEPIPLAGGDDISAAGVLLAGGQRGHGRHGDQQNDQREAEHPGRDPEAFHVYLPPIAS